MRRWVMKKYGSLWNNINNLLSSLRSCHVVEMIDDYYLGEYGNDAPGKVTRTYIEELQKYK